MSEKNCEIFIESDKSSFDSGISTTDKDINIKTENIINYNDILENLNTQKIFYDELRKRLSQLTDRRAKKKKFELCNICFAQLDTEDIKTCTPCCQCEKSVCRGKNCSYWLPKLAKWECQLCNLSNASQSRTKEWINKQVKTENEIYHPIRARSELNIPILDDKLSATQSLNYIPTCSTTSSTTGLNLHKEKIRNHVEEILADMLGGSLDNISVGPMSKNKQYYNLFNKYHTHLSEKLCMLENTIQNVNFNKSHYNYHNINNNHNHHQCNHQYNNFNNGNHCQSLPYKDLPLWESNSTNNLDTNNPTNISHFKLKRLIERIVEETLRIPQLTDFSGVPQHLSSSDNHLQLQHQNYDRQRQRHRSSSRRSSKLSHSDDYDNYNEMYGNNPQYFDPKRYQELLATAVLNKIVDSCATEKKSIDPNKIRNIDNNHNKIIITKELCDASSSSSSHDPRSDSSLPDPIQDENVEDINVRLYADILNENFDRESILSDSLSTHKNIPEIISSDNDSIEDFVSVASGADSTWEENWLFKKRKLVTHPTGPIGMLVPAPREDIKTMIGDKSADEISDFSENEDDGYGNDNRNDSGPENDRIQNKIVIGGQNTVGLFDDLMEQTSLISKCSSSADNESYIETTNDYVDFKYGLNVKEEPRLDLTCEGVPLKTEAINAAIGVRLLKSEEPIAQSESETNNNIEITEPSIYTQPSNIDSEVPERNQQERNDNANGNHQQRRRSTIEFLAAIALGPVLTVCSPDINQDVLKTITNKTDVVSLLTQSENVNIEIEEEQYFDIDVHNRPDIPCSPSIEATESGISTPNFKQNNSGYVTPESGISTPNLKQSRSGTPTNSGKVSPTSKQVRFNENPTVINKRKRNRTIYDTELNESFIANVFVDHIIRAAENKNLENANKEETIENNIFDNNNLGDYIGNVPSSSKEEECTFILPSDVLTQISSLLSDIDLGSLKDDLIRSVSPIPFDNNLDIFICPPPPNFDIDVSDTGTPSACDINLENKNIINSENIIQEKSVPVTETEPIATENLTNCNTAENITTIVVKQAEQFDHSKSIANTSASIIAPETQPLEALGREKHIENDLTALTESESVTAETSITLHENNKDIEETRTAAESSESETIANTATAITENKEQNEENGKLMEEKSDLVEKTEKPVAEYLEHSQPVQDTPKADVETKTSATQSVENNKPVNDALTAIVKTEPSAQEKHQLITETITTVAETEILLLGETTTSAVKPLENNKSVENTALTNVETEIQVTVPIDNTELKEETLSTTAETQQQETEPSENSKSVQDIQTEIVTTETISGALLENNKVINETLTAVTETERLTTDSSENSKPVENSSTEGQAIEPPVIEVLENNETIQEISTVTLGIGSLSTKTLEDSSEENTASPILENETPSTIQVVENNKLIRETLTAVSKTELLPKESSESNNSVENSSTVVVEIEALDIDPAANSKISQEISIADTVNQPIETEQLNNNNSVKYETIGVVEIKPSDEKFPESSKSEENIASTNSEIETQIADSLEYTKFVEGALTAFASTEFETAESLANSKPDELKQTPIVQNTPLSIELLENNKIIDIEVSKTEPLTKECSESNNLIENLASLVALEMEAPVSGTQPKSNSIQEILTTNAEHKYPEIESLVSNNSIEKETTTAIEINTSAEETLEHSKPMNDSTTSIVEIESPAQEPSEKCKTAKESTSEVVKILDDSVLEQVEIVPAIAETEQFTEESLEIIKSVETTALEVVKNKATAIGLLKNNNITEEKLTAKETEIPIVELLKSENTSTSILETESIGNVSFEKSEAVEEMPPTVEQTVDDLVHDSLENTIHIQETSTAVLETKVRIDSTTLENSKSAEDTSSEVAKSVEDSVSKSLENTKVIQETVTIVAKSDTESIEHSKLIENTATAYLEMEAQEKESLQNSKFKEEIIDTVVKTEATTAEPFENSEPLDNRTTSVAAITESEEQNGENGKLKEKKSDQVEETETSVSESLEHSQLVLDTPMTDIKTKPTDTQSIGNNKTVNDTLIASVETELPVQEKNLEKNQLIIETTIAVPETEILSPEESTLSIVQPFESNKPVVNTTITNIETEIQEDRTTRVGAKENELSTTTTLENNNLIEEISSKVEETEQIGATAVVKIEEQIAPSTAFPNDLHTKELLQNNKQNTSTPVTETQPLAIVTEENNKPDNDTSIKITETDLTSTELFKMTQIIDEGTASSTTEIQQIEKPIKQTPSANTEIESLSEETSQISDSVHSTPTEIAETKPSTAESDCKNIVEKSSTAITESSSSIIKLSEVVELDDSFHFEMILPPPVEFQNITNDESPTSLNLLEEIEPISEILEAVKNTDSAVVKNVPEVFPTTTAAEFEPTISKVTSLLETQLISNALVDGLNGITETRPRVSEPLENTNLKNEALTDVIESELTAVETLIINISAEVEQTIDIENKTVTKEQIENNNTVKDASTVEAIFDQQVESPEMVIETEPTVVETTAILDKKVDLIEGLSEDSSSKTRANESSEISKAVEETTLVIAEPLSTESKLEITKSLQSLENLQPPKDVPDTPFIVKEPESTITQSMENTELSENTQTAAEEIELQLDKSQFIEESLTIVKDIETPAKEPLEINKSMEEKMSIIAETKSLAEQSLEIHDVPKDALTEVIKREFSATTDISSSVQNKPKVVIENEPPTEQLLGNNNTQKDTTTSSEKIAEIETAVANSIAVLDNTIDSSDTPNETAKIEPPAIEVLEKNKLIEETLTAFGNNEAPDTKLIEPSNPIEETASNIAEAESPTTQSIGNLEPPKDSSTVVIESEPAVDEPLSVSSSVQNEPPAVIENETQTSKTNYTIKESPTIEPNPQVKSLEIFAEVEQTAVPLTAVEDKILEIEPDVGLSEEISTAIEHSDKDIEAPATELSAISTSMEQTIPFIVERETPATQLLENPELLKDSPTDIIESEPTIITKSVSISTNNEPTVVIENKTPDKELLENNITVNEIQNVETYPHVESLEIGEEIQNKVFDINVGPSENKPTAAEEGETSTEEISTAVDDIEAPAKESLVINKSAEEKTLIIAKLESLTTQAIENTEILKDIPTNVIESKPIESPATQLIENPEPPKNSPTDIIESEPAIIKSVGISAINDSTVVIENETLNKEQFQNKNTITIDRQVEVSEIVSKILLKDVESIALPDEKIDTSVDVIDSSHAEDITEIAKLESPTSEVEEVYTTPPESPKSKPVEYTKTEIVEIHSVSKEQFTVPETNFEVSQTSESNKTLKDTTNKLTEPKPVISALLENSKSVEHTETVSSLESKLEITKPLDNQSVEHIIIATAKTISDRTEINESAENSSEAVVTGESPTLEPSDNSDLVVETVTSAAETEPEISETRPEPEIVENKQVVMEPTAILDKNLNTIKQSEEKLSSGETVIATDTVLTVSELSKDTKSLETTKNTAAETESAVLQPDVITVNKLESIEINELATNISLNEIIIINEQTVTNTIPDVDLSKQISKTDSIDEIIITLPTAIENHIIDSDIENIELTDLIIPPPFDFASEDNSETTKNDESIPIQASHNTSQIELINDFVENNSKILDTEITVINNNITTSSTNSETILSNDLAKDSDKNLENNLKLSGSSMTPPNSPTKAICDKESTQTVLETGHNTNHIVEEILINKEAVLTEITDDNQSTQISILTQSASITESSNLPINSKNENSANETALEETNNPDATIQDKTTEVPSSSPYDTTQLPEVKLQSITNTTSSPTILNSNLDTNIVSSMEHRSGNSTNLKTKEVEVTSENENSLNITDDSNKTDEMQQTETIPETLAAIKSFENTKTPEAPTEDLVTEDLVTSPPLAIIETQNTDDISLDQQIITKVSNSIFESNEAESTDIKKEVNETSSANQTIKELKSERTSSDSTDESTHTILDATEEAQTITPTDENLINHSSTRPNLNGNENRIPIEESITNTLKTSTTTDTDDIVMLHDQNILNMEINDSKLTDNKSLNIVISNDNNVQNLTKNILENTNNTNIIDNTNINIKNTNINTNINSETNFINKIVIANPNSETNFINKIIYFGDGNNDILNNNNDVQNEIINELISEKIEPILVTNTNNITPKLGDTKNTEAFCKTLDISDEDDEQNNNNLIPGSIAEREHKKWYNAVEMPNNPYAPEALLRRLDSKSEVLLDIPQRHVTNTEISSPVEEEEIITAVKLNPKKIDLSIYSRDYYVPTTTTTKTNSTKNKLIKMSCIENDQELQQQQQQSQQILNDNKELLNEEQKPISDEIVQIFNNNEQSNEQPINDTICDNKLNLNSNSKIDNENIFSAKLIQINDMTDDEPTKSLLELSITSASDKLKTDSSPSDISLANSLTLSEDSDTLRVYNLNKQETTFILKENQQKQSLPQQLQQLQLTETSSTVRYFNDITNTPPNTPITPIIPKIIPRAPRIRPTELNLQQQTSSQSLTNTDSGGSGSGKTAMVLTPQSFKFLHPKRKIIEPSQILTQEQYTTPPETPDKIVIEEEIVHTLPSVKALAKAFLLTQGKLSDVHNSNVRPKSLIVETTSDKFETKDQIIKTISHENLTTPIDKVSNDTIKQDENQNNITISERPLSPVLLATGKLKDNIAFFENLKKN